MVRSGLARSLDLLLEALDLLDAPARNLGVIVFCSVR
jgi:hypothetical protein